MNDRNDDQIREIWQNANKEHEPMTVETVKKLSHKFTKSIHWRDIREYIAALLVILAFGYYAAVTNNDFIKIGSLLVIGAAIFIAIQLHKKSSINLDIRPSSSVIDFYRDQLKTECDLMKNIWLWYILPFAPGHIFFTIGMAQKLSPSQLILPNIFVIAVCALVLWYNSVTARKLQCQIDELPKE